MSRLFLFGIGGTGARVIRSFTMMLAAGGDKLDSSLEIVPIILDHDKNNGDLTRTKLLLNSYHTINNGLYPNGGTNVYQDSFFTTRITPLNRIGNAVSATLDWHIEFGAAANIANSLTYSDYINLSTITATASLSPTVSLIEALYNDSPSSSPEAELNMDLQVGFRGNPNIGVVVYNELRNDPNFKGFLSSCNPGNGDKVFIVGSIFGGTGSSGIPVIVDEIRKSPVGSVNRVDIGVALVHPYFSLKDKAESDDPNNINTGAIDPSLFKAKTKAALEAYKIGGNSSFNSRVTELYYIGDEYTDRYEYQEGRERQQNGAHVVEWAAATAILDFLRASSYNPLMVKELKTNADAGNIKAIDLPELPGSFKNITDPLSTFVIAMRYYREVICGTRNQINSSTAFYNTFDLNKNLGTGIYKELDDFVTDAGWGFYAWLKELEDHGHSFKPYRLDASGKDQRNVLSHKTVPSPFLGSNPTSDNNISEEINELTKNSGKSEATFIKALHDAATMIYNKIKK